MEKKARVFQYKGHVAKFGVEGASWYVGWYDQNGKRHAKSCGSGARGKNQAEKLCRRIEAELDAGIHHTGSRKTWTQFQDEYEEKILALKAHKTVQEAKVSLAHFMRLAKPGRVENIKTQSIDEFVSKRRFEAGRKPGSKVSPATLNKDLRHIKAAIRVAVEWGYLPKTPKIRMVREPEKLKRFVTPEDFETIYLNACPLAKFPKNPQQLYAATDWWQALVVTAYMTGMPIGELIAIKTVDVDLERGYLVTRAADNKGKRDEQIKLHDVVIEHLRKIMGPDKTLFRWHHDRRTLGTELHRIQKAAGVHLHCPENHEHTPSCHTYGLHDFRRAFATVNAPSMKPEALQKLMRHKSYKTTLVYVNLASQVEDAVKRMPVPIVLQFGRHDTETRPDATGPAEEK